MRTLSTAVPLLIGAVMVLSRQVLAQPATTLNFDNLSDATTITNQFQGLTFRNAAAISAGISLNEFEFPPHSGSNVIFDNGGPIAITFSTPIQSFAGYFTYAAPVSVQALSSSGSQLISATSRFSNNEAMSGAPGSNPNELIQLSSGDRISKIVITGSPSGNSFVLDDTTVSIGAMCNVTEDGAASVTDVQIIINEALGVAPPVDDLNGDSLVNTVDVQIVTNAALGLGCSRS